LQARSFWQGVAPWPRRHRLDDKMAQIAVDCATRPCRWSHWGY